MKHELLKQNHQLYSCFKEMSETINIKLVKFIQIFQQIHPRLISIACVCLCECVLCFLNTAFGFPAPWQKAFVYFLYLALLT